MPNSRSNTDKVLIENPDCRILFTEQHQLGIDVGGYVIVRDPLEWHRVMKQSRETNHSGVEVSSNLNLGNNKEPHMPPSDFFPPPPPLQRMKNLCIEYRPPDLGLAYTTLAPKVTEALAFLQCGEIELAAMSLKAAKEIIDNTTVIFVSCPIEDINP